MNRTARLVPALALSAIVIGSAGAGSAVAAKMVTGKDIKNNTVASVDVKNSSLSGKDVKNNALQEVDLAPGVKGKLNKPTLNGYEIKKSSVLVPTTGSGQAYVFCSPGKVAVGGGAEWDVNALEAGAVTQQSYPGKDFGDLFAPLEDGDVATAWTVVGEANNLDALNLTAYVICVNPS